MISPTEGSVPQIRRATVADAEGIARVHVATWQAAYADLLPVDFLAGLRWQDRADAWRERLIDDSADAATWVVTNGTRILGFASIGPARDEDRASPTSWELYGIYLGSDVWRQGLGRAVAQRALDEIPDVVVDVSLWVLADNARARRFYERLGFAPDGTTKTDTIGGGDVVELRYLLPAAPHPPRHSDPPVARAIGMRHHGRVERPRTRYTTTADGVAIAYQVVGSGSTDFVFVNSAFASNVELIWQWPMAREVVEAFAQRGRLVLFDRRGSGLSDSVFGDRLPTVEARAEDIRSVLDAVGAERVVLYGLEDGAAQCFLFGAMHPERTRAIITVGAASRGLWSPATPWLWDHARWDAEISAIEEGWGSPEFAHSFTAEVFPSYVDDEAFVDGFDTLMRHSLRRNDAIANERMYRDMDVRHVLPLIQAPTLLMHYRDDAVEPVAEARAIAVQIPGATLVELPGADHLMLGDLPTIDGFLRSLDAEEEVFDRVLSTVLFTDIVGSTELATSLGDRRWAELLAKHDQVVRALLGRYRGLEIDTAGDGFFATFDGPARAVRCAQAVCEAVRAVGVEVRAGVHTGEVTLVGDNVRGAAVHVGARVGAKAQASEVLVSQTVKDLIAGSTIVLEDAGTHQLKGVEGEWRLYRVR